MIYDEALYCQECQKEISTSEDRFLGHMCEGCYTPNKRIIVVNGHIVVQHFAANKWWTCNKVRKPHNDATDLAVYPNSPGNMRMAREVAGIDAPEVTPEGFLVVGPAGNNQWCISSDNWRARYNTRVEAIAALALTVE